MAARLWGNDSLFRRSLTESLSPVTIVFLEHVVLVLVLFPLLAESAAVLGAALLWGASTVFGRYIVARVPNLVLTALRFAIALPMLALLFAVQPRQNRSMPMNIGSIALLVAMAMVPGFLALTSYYCGLRFTTASLASVGEPAFPITAVAANWYVLGIPLNVSQVTGAIILVTAVNALPFMGSRRPAAFVAAPDAGALGERTV